MNQLCKFSLENSKCVVNKFIDPVLEEIEVKLDPLILTHRDKFFYYYEINNEAQHGGIVYAISSPSLNSNLYTVFTLKLIKENEKETLEYISKLPFEIKRLFIRFSLVDKVKLMDYFQFDFRFWEKNDIFVSFRARTQVADLITEAVKNLRREGYCYTDIKIDQILLRPVSEDREQGYYRIVDNDGKLYELAITDLDMNRCLETKAKNVYTYRVPKSFIKPGMSKTELTERQLIWSYLITIMDIFKIKNKRVKNDPNSFELSEFLTKIEQAYLIPCEYKLILLKGLMSQTEDFLSLFET